MSRLRKLFWLPLVYWALVCPVYAGWVVDGENVIILKDLQQTSVWTEADGGIFYNAGPVLVGDTNVSEVGTLFEVRGPGRIEDLAGYRFQYIIP